MCSTSHFELCASFLTCRISVMLWTVFTTQKSPKSGRRFVSIVFWTFNRSVLFHFRFPGTLPPLASGTRSCSRETLSSGAGCLKGGHPSSG